MNKGKETNNDSNRLAQRKQRLTATRIGFRDVPVRWQIVLGSASIAVLSNHIIATILADAPASRRIVRRLVEIARIGVLVTPALCRQKKCANQTHRNQNAAGGKRTRPLPENLTQLIKPHRRILFSLRKKKRDLRMHSLASSKVARLHGRS